MESRYSRALTLSKSGEVAVCYGNFDGREEKLPLKTKLVGLYIRFVISGGESGDGRKRGEGPVSGKSFFKRANELSDY